MAAKRANRQYKTPPLALPGAVSPLHTRCGKVNCRCTRGALHGPYYRRQWYEGGRLRSAYVRKRDLERVTAACDAYRRQQQDARDQRRAIEELSWFEFREMRKQIRAIYREYGL